MDTSLQRNIKSFFPIKIVTTIGQSHTHYHTITSSLHFWRKNNRRRCRFHRILITQRHAHLLSCVLLILMDLRLRKNPFDVDTTQSLFPFAQFIYRSMWSKNDMMWSYSLFIWKVSIIIPSFLIRSIIGTFDDEFEDNNSLKNERSILWTIKNHIVPHEMFFEHLVDDKFAISSTSY